MQDKANFKKKYTLSHKKFDGAGLALTKFPFKILPRNTPSKYLFATFLRNILSQYFLASLPRITPSQYSLAILLRNTPSQHSPLELFNLRALKISGCLVYINIISTYASEKVNPNNVVM